MWKNYDWECATCEHVVEDMIKVQAGNGAPRYRVFHCETCKRSRKMKRLISLPARYTGDAVMNPMISGGRFDTVGDAALPPLPPMPNDLNKSAMKDFFNQPSYKAVKAKRAEVSKRNTAKKHRAALIKRGDNINMRADRLPGDPNLR